MDECGPLPDILGPTGSQKEREPDGFSNRDVPPKTRLEIRISLEIQDGRADSPAEQELSHVAHGCQGGMFVHQRGRVRVRLPWLPLFDDDLADRVG